MNLVDKDPADDLDRIVADISNKGLEDSGLSGFYFGMKEIAELFRKYFPHTILVKGLKRMESNQIFKQPLPAVGVTGEEFLRRFHLLLWDENILRRFFFFALMKAVSEVINTRLIGKKSANYIHELFLYLSFLRNLKMAGTSNFVSMTINSKNQKLAKSATTYQFERIFENYEEVLLDFEASFRDPAFAGLSEEKISEFYKNFTELDIKKFEKDIFYGILGDFEITKLQNGKQSIRAKVLLLMELFQHTHSHLYHSSGSFDGRRSKDDLNYESLYNLIQSPGNIFS
jgi:hypothetical protein